MPVYGGDVDIPNVSLHDYVWENMLEHGDDMALIDNSRGGKYLTYKQIYDSSKKCAVYLQSRGIKKGDFVAICAPNCLEWSFLMLGILGSGAATIPCNPSYHKRELLHTFSITPPKMAFVTQRAIETMKAVKLELQSIKELIVIGNSSDFKTVAQMLMESSAETLKHVVINPADDLAIIPQSSGTTGLPKNIAKTHKNYVAVTVIDKLKARDPSECYYSDRPMYHGAGFSRLIRNIAMGIKSVFETEFEVEKMLKAVETYKHIIEFGKDPDLSHSTLTFDDVGVGANAEEDLSACCVLPTATEADKPLRREKTAGTDVQTVTTALCVPSGLIGLSNVTDIEKYDFSTLRTLCCTGAISAPDVARRVTDMYGIKFQSIYGVTEFDALTDSLNSQHDWSSCGNIKPGMELKIVDLITKNECPTGQLGEIVTRGPLVTPGYLENPKANAVAFDEDGWFRTGDIGYLDKNERIYIVDRIKEVIKYKAVQVSPAELESVIHQHPKVADVGVIGVPDEECGELPKALVVARDESLTDEEILSIVKENLVDYKHLRGGVTFVQYIPRSITGKIQRSELKKLAAL